MKIMKKLIFFLVAIAIPFAGLTDSGSISISGADAVKQVLPIYKSLSGAELVIASNVQRVYSTITVDTPPGKQLDKAEAMKLIEKALIDQAGIILTRLDDKRVSVTYNDALKTTPR
jgi:hypothetical protein